MDALARLGGTARRVGGKVVARGLKLAGYGTLLADTASSRWYLLLDCVPTCCGVLAMRFLVADVMGLHFFPLETISSFANSAIFILAIMLAGVLEDYKESESIPAEIASCFDAIAEQVSLAAALAAAKGEPRAVDARALSRELLGLLEAVFEFIAGLRDDTDLLAALTINAQYASAVVGAADVGVDGSDVLAPFAELRQHVLRMHVIKRTDFLASGYSLMELLVWITIIMACFGEYAARSEAYVNVGLTAMQFLYVIALLRDIDDPFDYEPEKLFPIVEPAEEDSEEDAEGGEDDESGEGDERGGEGGEGRKLAAGEDDEEDDEAEEEDGEGEGDDGAGEGASGEAAEGAAADAPDRAASRPLRARRGGLDFSPFKAPVVTVPGVGASAEIDQYPLLNAYARVARLAGLPMGRAAPPPVFDAATNSLVKPSVLLRGQGGRAVAAKRAAYSTELRRRMRAAWGEADAAAVAIAEAAAADADDKRALRKAARLTAAVAAGAAAAAAAAAATAGAAAAAAGASARAGAGGKGGGGHTKSA